MTAVKICGITTIEDALLAADLGADAIGLNFVARSPRRIAWAQARAIVDALAGATLVVGVVADLDEGELRALVAETGIGCLQLHGDEPPEALVPFLPHAYKALRIGSAEDVARAASYPGDYLLADAKVEGALGGTGATFDWSLARDLAAARKLTLAGGLDPSNVAEAIRTVRPFCVDVASGVEQRPGVKDAARMRAFIDAARSA